MNHKLPVLLVALLAFVGNAHAQYCTDDARFTEVSFFDSTQLTLAPNIQYGIAADFQGNPDTLLMDLYYPNLTIDPALKRPFILLAHGGGFSSGDKQLGDIRDLCVHLAMRGFVCASINYRLGYDFTEYGQYKARYRAIQDGNAALRFVANNANTVRIDTSWLFVGGQSAGSLLALGMVYADQVELDSIALLYSATATSTELGNLHTSGNNLTNTYTIKGMFNNWGGVAESEVDVDEMIPTVAFHGELDDLVPIDSDNSFAHYTLSGSRALHNDLTANNSCSELTVDVTGGHGIYRDASSIFRAQRASCFFKQVFCNDCTNFYSTDSIAATCSDPLSLEEPNFESRVNVYPNPFETTFTIDGIEGPCVVTIYNGLGQVIYQNENSNGVAQLDVQPGMYLLQIHQVASNKTFTTKLIKN